ncbi:MAG: chloride channel protein [Thermoplasmata archaeon]|nr:MAG: chloride channel protein [Thermoplasmata archaeon]
MAKRPRSKGRPPKSKQVGMRKESKRAKQSRWDKLHDVFVHNYTVFNILAVTVGVICGFIAIGFRYLIFGMYEGFQINNIIERGNPWNYWYIIFIPMIGGLIVGLLTYYLAKEAKGHGVPEVMEAVAVHSGRMRPRLVGVKALASAVTIGSGGSAGREGPIVVMGSTSGSSIAQMLRLSPYQTRVLLACGAAGGISATFNTPIAGVLFALELIITEFKTRSFIPIVISSVFGTVISRSILGLLGVEETFVFDVPQYTLATPWELIFYLILGVLAGVTAILFIKTLYYTEDAFDKLKIPPYTKPMLGGLCVGLIGFTILLYTSEATVFGVGYGSIEALLSNDVVFHVIVALIILKIIATSLTIGSGGSGGVFAPSLFIGAMLGGAFGLIVHGAFPDITAGHEAYVLVGMAALFAGSSRATLTAIVIIFEMTGDYYIILPLMFSCVIADAIGAYWLKDSIYTCKLRRRGIRIQHGRDINLMEAITVKETMTRDVQTVQEDMKISQLSRLIQETGHMAFPVMDSNYYLIGIVTHSDVRRALKEGKASHPVREIETTKLITVTPENTLNDALMRIGDSEINHLPVVTEKDPKKLEGFLTKGDIIRAYRRRQMAEVHDGKTVCDT